MATRFRDICPVVTLGYVVLSLERNLHAWGSCGVLDPDSALPMPILRFRHPLVTEWDSHHSGSGRRRGRRLPHQYSHTEVSTEGSRPLLHRPRTDLHRPRHRSTQRISCQAQQDPSQIAPRVYTMATGYLIVPCKTPYSRLRIENLTIVVLILYNPCRQTNRPS